LGVLAAVGVLEGVPDGQTRQGNTVGNADGGGGGGIGVLEGLSVKVPEPGARDKMKGLGVREGDLVT
jgi:hypothetical protein